MFHYQLFLTTHLNIGIVPDDWKDANVSALYKQEQLDGECRVSGGKSAEQLSEYL